MSGIDGMDWAGIIVALTGMLGMIGGGFAWLVRFIVKQANAVNAALKDENAELKNRVQILEVRDQARRGNDP